MSNNYTVTISKQFEPVDGKVKIVYNVKVVQKMPQKTFHYKYPTLDDAKRFCKERFGGFSKIYNAL